MASSQWQDEELWIVTAVTHNERPTDGAKEVTRGINPYASSTVSGEELKDSRIKAEKLEAQMSQFVRVVSRLFGSVQKQVEPQAGLQLDEITLSVEIGGEGEIKLLGTGVKAAGKGAIELKFKRSESSKPVNG
ncbi:hypothetical protein [Pseudanabaena sp. PCC 6802]|uniref:Pepco domain-containing protein n=1 Tax=Pseudanabaena sp. PCC 6802 TaxID=118173 RepID=UPI000348F53C|nr:hypothetical protein [Pseudanabaena sp. PCC 6802]